MTLEDFLAKLKGYAQNAWAAVLSTANTVIEEAAPVVDAAFEKLVEACGQFAVNKVVELMGEAFDHLSGSEKANLVATSITDEAARLGVAANPTHVSTLVETSYVTAAAQRPKAA